MIKIPTNTRELGEGLESFKKDVTVSTEKAVTSVGKDVTGQISPTEFVSALYAPTAKKPEAGSGETGGFADQITPKPGELFGNIAGAPLEPGQEQQTESALGQISIPVDKLTSTMMGSPIEPGESVQTEDPFEQLLPTSNQVGTWASGSTTTQRVTPHMETAGQQIIPSIDEVSGILGIPSTEAGGIPAQRQAPAAEQSAASAGVGQTPEQPSAESMQGPDTMQNPASQPPEVQQMMQQQQQQASQSKAEIGPVDSAMQMSSEEKSRLDAAQKELRELRMQHDYFYIKGPLDTSPSLQQELAKKQQETKQREEQMKQEEEEEEKKKKEEEEQKKQELPEPGTKDKPGNPNIAIGQSQKKTEVHRGAAG